ncbi:hypothetical protein L1887_31543 [Cichorium endivia]|nr:hypothetical protein L1887_31543 [Cichorium endivia]
MLGTMNSNLFSYPPNSSRQSLILLFLLITLALHPFTSLQTLLKDLGNLSYFLGVEVLHHSAGLFLSQSKYILDLLHKANMSDCKPTTTLLSSSIQLTINDGKPIPTPTDYRSLVGSLKYLSLTRSDVAFAVNKLS